MCKEGFIAFLNKNKTSKYYILLNIRLSCIFSAFYKICLYYLCLERLHYLNRKGEEGKKWFFEESRAEIGSRCSENVPPMALFTPTAAPKRGGKGRLKRGANGHFKNIINTFDIKTQCRKGGTTGIKEHFTTLYGVKQQEDKQGNKYTFYTNIQ